VFGDQDIHLRSLRDAQQFSDPHGEAQRLGISSANWALFGVIWDSSQVLARLMLDFEIGGKRILELGCGIALSSLLINRRGGDITATDYHPEAGPYLLNNTRLNDDGEIPFFRADWENAESTHGKFDLIIGSDILYERDNMTSLAKFIQGHARKKCEVVVVDPGRKQSGQFSQRMTGYGFTHQRNKPEDVSYLAKPFTGSILQYSR
jgi:predicted nicotinamide N-methyase